MTNRKITLSPEQQSKFEMAIKIGIAKELSRNEMLTDTQLSLILSDIRKQNMCLPHRNTCEDVEDAV